MYGKQHEWICQGKIILNKHSRFSYCLQFSKPFHMYYLIMRFIQVTGKINWKYSYFYDLNDCYFCLFLYTSKQKGQKCNNLYFSMPTIYQIKKKMLKLILHNPTFQSKIFIFYFVSVFQDVYKLYFCYMYLYHTIDTDTIEICNYTIKMLLCYLISYIITYYILYTIYYILYVIYNAYSINVIIMYII